MIFNKRQRQTQNILWIFPTMLALGAGLPVTVTAEEAYPALDPPYYNSGIVPDQSAVEEKLSSKAATTEWTYHKTADGSHPSGHEQQALWLMNRARFNPTQEGIWLASSTDPEVAGERDYFGVNKTTLRSEFASYAAKGPAAFDNRLYAAAYAHSVDLIARDAQDHTNQFARVDSAGFHYTQARGSVFSFASSGINAHAAWNIDWGYGADGMQDGRGHRMATMSVDGDYTNVGIAAIHETNSATDVGEYVTTGNYCQANTGYSNHYNMFIVGTVWTDVNGNDQYDPGEGKANVTVRPSQGTYYAITGSAGGYAIPVGNGTYSVTFSGGGLTDTYTKSVTVSGKSALLDVDTSSDNPSDNGSGEEGVVLPPTLLLLL
ncbi:hypothetical protein [Desulfogranum japonicum]|uniref:hypothetical protein n=1 Tax=Desulfogranum japonicum TaxID=231447 RepID=UPI000490CD0A|nr:hypothetical protein [Desulfogranum japonicum]